jgi:NADH dehydrogenase (ubiquinone) Fe-S protein 6
VTALSRCGGFANAQPMSSSAPPPPETVRITHHRVSCDGASDVRGGAALGHPRVWLEIDEKGYVDCGYCDRRFILEGGPADGQ